MAKANQPTPGRKAQRRAEAIKRAKQRRRLTLGGGLAIVVVLAGGILAMGGGSGGEPALAADFELEQLGEEAAVRLSDFRGSPVAVTFMHSW